MRLVHLITCWLSFIGLAVSQQDTSTSRTCIPPGPALNSQRPDFAACLVQIDNLTVSQRSESGCFENANTGVLTFSGCELMCGSSYSLWEWKDTVNRLSLLVLPTIVLIAHLAFPPLGWWNYLVVTFHAVGNPIGSLRSVLTRLERHRRLRRAANAAFSGDRLGMRATATVFATFEELSWQDVSGHLRDMMIGKGLDQDERAILMRVSHQLSSTRLASTSSAAVAIIALVATLASAIVQTIKQIDEVNTRVYNETAGTIAVTCIIFIAIPLVWFSARLGTFTTDSGASHILETMNERLKKVAAAKNLPNLLFPPLQLAACPLQPRERRPGLLAWLSRRLPYSISAFFDSFFSHCPLEVPPPIQDSENETFLRTKIDYSSYISLNSAWRPCKHLSPDHHGCSHGALTTISVISVVFGACLPAIFLSLTNHGDQRSLAPGCRSLSWVAILGIWISSFVLDSIFRFFICQFSRRRDPMHKVRLLWQWTVAKDALVACSVTTLILLVELGRYNSCWCRASFSHPLQVTLFPYTAEQWSEAQIYWTTLPGAGLIINLALILWVELSFTGWIACFPWFRLERGSPLCKGGKEMQAELDELRLLERRDLGHVTVDENMVPGVNKPSFSHFEILESQESGEIIYGQEDFSRVHGSWRAL